jgi:hypothetical protein
VTLGDGRLLLVGGYNDLYGVLNDSLIYDPMTGTWQAAGALPVPLVGFGVAATPDGSVMIAGGTAADGTTEGRRETYLFDAAALSWLAGAPMSVARTNAGAAAIAAAVVVVGGVPTIDAFKSSALDTFEVIGPFR